jgi:hypothetical protein
VANDSAANISATIAKRLIERFSNVRFFISVTSILVFSRLLIFVIIIVPFREPASASKAIAVPSDLICPVVIPTFVVYETPGEMRISINSPSFLPRSADVGQPIGIIFFPHAIQLIMPGSLRTTFRVFAFRLPHLTPPPSFCVAGVLPELPKTPNLALRVFRNMFCDILGSNWIDKHRYPSAFSH